MDWARLIPPVLGGALMGIAHLHPDLALVVWPGLALFGYGLHRLTSSTAKVLAIIAALWASLFISQIWLSLTFAHYMAPLFEAEKVSLWISTPAWALTALISCVQRSIPVLLGALFLKRAPLRLWLPPALLLGEEFNGAMGFTMGDIMHSQWAVAPILQSIALIGLPLTGLLCGYVAVSLGEFAAQRQPMGATLALPVALWFALLPAIPPADEALVGVAATHLADFDRRPTLADLPPGVELMLWPEAAIRGAYNTWEGPQEPPLPLQVLDHLRGVQHVVNLKLKRPEQILNAVGVTDRDGRVLSLRGKSSLAPWGERPYAGLDPLYSIDAQGQTPPYLNTLTTRLVPTVCYEVFERSIFVEGVHLGGELLVNLANDRATGPSELGIRQATGVLALRAAELHRPAARASIHGRSALISSTGALLTISERDTSGVVTYAPEDTPQPTGPRALGPDIAILSDGTLPDPFPCIGPSCVAPPLSSNECPAGLREVPVVILSGHSMPPRYLGLSPADLAKQVTCLQPQLVVLDTCYGFSAPLLEAFAAAGLEATVVGPTEQVANGGLRYSDAFFSASSPLGRAQGITASTQTPLEIWQIDEADLARAHLALAALSAAQLRSRLKRVHPNLVDGELGSGTRALFIVPPSRF